MTNAGNTCTWKAAKSRRDQVIQESEPPALSTTRSTHGALASWPAFFLSGWHGNLFVHEVMLCSLV